MSSTWWYWVIVGVLWIVLLLTEVYKGRKKGFKRIGYKLWANNTIYIVSLALGALCFYYVIIFFGIILTDYFEAVDNSALSNPKSGYVAPFILLFLATSLIVNTFVSFSKALTFKFTKEEKIYLKNYDLGLKKKLKWLGFLISVRYKDE